MPKIYRTDPTAFANIEEANRAIYIDFEGKETEAPALVGILIEGCFWQEVLDPRLHMAADEEKLRVRAGEDVLEELIKRARQEERRIAAFTTSECDKAKHWFKVDIEKDAQYLNAHWLGKRWWLDGLAPGGRPPKGQDFSLEEFEKLLGMEKSKHFGKRKATKKLDSITDQCLKKERYEAVSPGGKRSWTNLLEYNKLDVEHTAELVRHVVSSVS